MGKKQRYLKQKKDMKRQERYINLYVKRNSREFAILIAEAIKRTSRKIESLCELISEELVKLFKSGEEADAKGLKKEEVDL